MKRSDVALQPAPGPEVLKWLPRVNADGPHFRVHQERPGIDGGCWWFAGIEGRSEPGGRFDLPVPRGTLYLAETRLAAALELCGRYLAGRVPIPVTAIEGRVVSQIEGKLTDLGDLTDKDAAKVGVTREISSIDSYKITVSWASGADALSFNGLKYNPRFSTANDAALAIFGDAGANVPTGLSISSAVSLGQVLYEEGFAPKNLPSMKEAIDDSVDNIETR